MKPALTAALLALFAAPALGGSRLAVNDAPAPVRPLAEAETNVVFDAGSPAENKWRLSIELDVSPTNCVEVVFGADADGDGALGLAEGELCVGWDCGGWFWRDRRADVLRRAAGTGRRLDWTLMLDRDRSARRLFSPSFPETVTPTCFSPEWNMARVVVRGADSVQVSSRVVVDALILRIR